MEVVPSDKSARPSVFIVFQYLSATTAQALDFDVFLTGHASASHFAMQNTVCSQINNDFQVLW